MPPVPLPAVSEDPPGGRWAVYPHALYTDILELRTLIAVLDAVLTRHAVNNSPSGEEGVRCSRKKKQSPRGDVPNRHKTPHDPEYSSTSGDEASDEDAD
jgi:hypothetical protein